jgi:hypothetical protein
MISGDRGGGEHLASYALRHAARGEDGRGLGALEAAHRAPRVAVHAAVDRR